MVVLPEAKYGRTSDLHIDYQVVGGGPIGLVFLPDWVNHIEAQWRGTPAATPSGCFV